MYIMKSRHTRPSKPCGAQVCYLWEPLLAPFQPIVRSLKTMGQISTKFIYIYCIYICMYIYIFMHVCMYKLYPSTRGIS